MRQLTLVLLLILLTACDDKAGKQEVKQGEANNIEAKQNVGNQLNGKALADQYLIVDSHIDVPWRLKKEMADVGHSTDTGDFDYPRALEGGLNVPFMSIYIPASVDEAGGAKALADEMIDLVENIVTSNPDKFALAYTTAEIDRNFKAHKISLAMGMENGGPIAGDLQNLKHFYDRGIRYITLTHSKSNHISDSSYDDNKRWDGLSKFGEEVVAEMNRLGIMVDISHVSDAAFFDTLRISKVAVIASHSSARHFTPGFERNMDDAMLLALAKNGGVMQLNIGSSFLTQISRERSSSRSDLIKQALADSKLDADSDAGKAVAKRIREENPTIFATMDDVLDHVDHVVNLVGIEHLGIGTDFDGVGDSLPIGFKDVSAYPAFIDGLIARGYSQVDIEKILSGNIMRVWKAVEAYASADSTQSR